MPDYVPKLLLKVVMVYELEGVAGVEKYARANGIPHDVCKKLLDEYVLPQSPLNMASTPAKAGFPPLF